MLIGFSSCMTFFFSSLLPQRELLQHLVAGVASGVCVELALSRFVSSPSVDPSNLPSLFPFFILFSIPNALLSLSFPLLSYSLSLSLPASLLQSNSPVPLPWTSLLVYIFSRCYFPCLQVIITHCSFKQTILFGRTFSFLPPHASPPFF